MSIWPIRLVCQLQLALQTLCSVCVKELDGRCSSALSLFTFHFVRCIMYVLGFDHVFKLYIYTHDIVMINTGFWVIYSPTHFIHYFCLSVFIFFYYCQNILAAFGWKVQCFFICLCNSYQAGHVGLFNHHYAETRVKIEVLSSRLAAHALYVHDAEKI